MKAIKFYGSSDDLIEVEGEIDGCDEYGQFGEKLKDYFTVQSESGAAKIYPIYDGCWSFAIGQTDESIPLPEWDIRVGNEHDYSTYLMLDVPDDAKITWSGNTEEQK